MSQNRTFRGKLGEIGKVFGELGSVNNKWKITIWLDKVNWHPQPQPLSNVWWCGVGKYLLSQFHYSKPSDWQIFKIWQPLNVEFSIICHLFHRNLIICTIITSFCLFLCNYRKLDHKATWWVHKPNKPEKKNCHVKWIRVKLTPLWNGNGEHLIWIAVNQQPD